MKTIQTFFAALAVMCAMFFFGSASPPTLAGESAEVKQMQIVIVGTGSVGLSSVVDRLQASGHTVQVIESEDRTVGDGLTLQTPELHQIASIRRLIPTATVEQTPPDTKRSIEYRESRNNHTTATFYNAPADSPGYRGESRANPTRADPLQI